MTGRSSRLRINYRNTEEILGWSATVLSGERIENLSGEGPETLVGYRSLLRGRRPVLAGFRSEADEISAAVDQVRQWRDAGADPTEIAVCARFHTVLDRVKERLA